MPAQYVSQAEPMYQMPLQSVSTPTVVSLNFVQPMTPMQVKQSEQINQDQPVHLNLYNNPSFQVPVQCSNQTPIAQQASTSKQTLQGSVQSVKGVKPDDYDGSDKIEWSDYIIHFEQCASWNNWSDEHKAKMLSIRLKGEAQTLLRDLKSDQLSNYGTLLSLRAQKFSPKEKVIAYRYKFRNTKREKNESVTTYRYNLKELGQKAYPAMTNDDLEPFITDQYVSGLLNYELQKHVQFGHPKTLNEAIALATEFKALEHSVDRVKKPQPSDSDLVASITTDMPSQNITLEQTGKILDEKLNNLLQSSMFTKALKSSNTPVSDKRQGDNDVENLQQPTNSYLSRSPQRSKQNRRSPVRYMFCDYCSLTNHTIERCRKRIRDVNKNKPSNATPNTNGLS